VGAEHECPHDAVKIPHQGEVGENARGRVTELRAAMVLTVKQAGLLGQNGVNAVKHVPLDMK